MPRGPPCAQFLWHRAGLLPVGSPAVPALRSARARAAGKPLLVFLVAELLSLTPPSYDTWVHANEIDAEIEDAPIPEKPWKVSLAQSLGGEVSL